mgnify:CR=1 FL=1
MSQAQRTGEGDGSEQQGVHEAKQDHDLWQEGSGSHYNQTYFYGTTSNSVIF